MHNLGDYLKDVVLPEPPKETYEDIEEEFAALIAFFKEHGLTDVKHVLKHIELRKVPGQYRRSFNFFKTLSGPSRNFMIDVAEGRRLNRKFAPEPKKGIPLRPYNRLSIGKDF